MNAKPEVLRVQTSLAGVDQSVKIQAVLAVPDDAKEAEPILEAALDAANSQLKVVLLEALWRLTEDPQVRAELVMILESDEAGGDAGEELYMMARIALNHVDGDDTDVIDGQGAGDQRLGVQWMGVGVSEKRNTLAVVIHGTWARDGKWWRPGGDFHSYLLDDLGVDYLYKEDEPFIWSGRNRGSARHNAAQAFGDWVAQFDPEKLEVYAHSHGANVAMLATRSGQPIDRLVMMSPPVREDYFANWDNVGSAYNIQAQFDPVVGIARGDQSFDLPNVKEIELDCDGHSSSHEPDVWERNEIPTAVGLMP